MQEAGCLFLARDRLGVKPLYYVELGDGALLFASELKGLLAHPLVRSACPIRCAIEDFLGLGYVPDDACIVAGVKQAGGGAPADRAAWACRCPRRSGGGISELRGPCHGIGRRAGGGAPRSSAPCGAIADGGGRAAGRVPVGRGRFVRGRRVDGRGEPVRRWRPVRSGSRKRGWTRARTRAPWRSGSPRITGSRIVAAARFRADRHVGPRISTSRSRMPLRFPPTASASWHASG